MAAFNRFEIGLQYTNPIISNALLRIGGTRYLDLKYQITRVSAASPGTAVARDPTIQKTQTWHMQGGTAGLPTKIRTWLPVLGAMAPPLACSGLRSGSAAQWTSVRRLSTRADRVPAPSRAARARCLRA